MDSVSVDRAHDRAEALATLGLSHVPTPSELKRAWRDAVFATHPDRNGGDHEPLARAKAAYEALKRDCQAKTAPSPCASDRMSDRARDKAPEPKAKHASDTAPEPASRPRAARTPSSPVRRPRVASAILPLNSTIRTACRAALLTGSDVAVTDLAAPGGDPTPGAARVTDHVPAALERKGRRLTYLFETPLAPGTNRVALPDGFLPDPGEIRPRIVRFDARDADGQVLTLPAALCGTAFPGAREVRVRFAAT